MATDISAAEGSSIVSWLRGNIDSMIASGECWDAAEAAIRTVGARRPSAALYTWGRVIPSANLRAGDVLQFSSFTVRVEQADGAWEEKTLGIPRHTSIVSNVNADGSVDVLHQNYDNVRSVQSLTRVYLRAGPYGGATVTVTGGTVTCYRPRKP